MKQPDSRDKKMLALALKFCALQDERDALLDSIPALLRPGLRARVTEIARELNVVVTKMRHLAKRIGGSA